MRIEIIIIIYFVFINALSICATATDKYNAMHKKNKRRVSESSLLTLAVLGGAITMLSTMLIIRHKTQKPKFMVTLPIIIMLEGALIFILKWQGVF